MDTLPQECLLHLLSFVALDSRSLLPLLLTNTTFFRLVVPLLYRDPFGFIQSGSSATVVQQQRQVALLRILLTCSTAFTTQDGLCPLPAKPTVDYLSLYAVHSERSLFNMISHIGTLAPSPMGSKQKQMLPSDTAVDTHYRPDIHTSLSSSTVPESGRQETLDVKQGSTLHHARLSQRLPSVVGLQARIHARLVSHSPPHIHTLSFFIDSIVVLQPFASRLSGLARLELFKRANRPNLSGALDFIASHRHHHTTLREIKVALIKSSEQVDLSCLIQALSEPRVIDVSRWPKADCYLDRFPLAKCRVLIMRLGETGASYIDPAFLSKFIQLRSIRMPVFHQRMFSWAATRHNDHASCANRIRDLASFTSMNLYGPDGLLVSALVDSCYAFRESLREVIGLSSFMNPIMEVFSLFWPMPRLVRLDLEGTVAVNFDLGSLEHCPVLQELRLNVARKIPSDWNPRSKVTQLARVSHHLRQLELSGWWGLCDEDLTRTLLSVLKRLYGLNLMWCRGPSNSCFLELLPQLTGLFSLAVSATPWEQSQLQHLKCSLALQMEIDVQIVE